MPVCMIISVLIASDSPRDNKCNKFVTFTDQAPLVTGDQQDQTKAHITSLQCAEAIDERVWSSDDG